MATARSTHFFGVKGRGGGGSADDTCIYSAAFGMHIVLQLAVKRLTLPLTDLHIFTAVVAWLRIAMNVLYMYM